MDGHSQGQTRKRGLSHRVHQAQREEVLTILVLIRYVINDFFTSFLLVHLNDDQDQPAQEVAPELPGNFQKYFSAGNATIGRRFRPTTSSGHASAIGDGTVPANTAVQPFAFVDQRFEHGIDISEHDPPSFHSSPSQLHSFQQLSHFPSASTTYAAAALKP